MKRLNSFIRIQDMVSEWSGRAISWMILVMVGAIMYEVISRYLFNAPTNWSMELSTMLYGSFCMLAGAYTLLHKGHVRMDVLYRLLPRRVKAGLDSFSGLLILGFLVLFLWTAIKISATSWANQEFSARSTWEPPLYPFKAVITLSILLILLQAIVTFIRNLLVFLKLEKIEGPDASD